MISNKKTKRIKKSLHPIYYESNLFSTKPTTDFVKNCFFPHLKNIIERNHLSDKINIEKQIKVLLEAIPHKDITDEFYTKNRAIFSDFYSSSLMAFKGYFNCYNHDKIYKKFHLTKYEGYMFIALCLAKLNYEKYNPSLDKWSFLDFPEHLIATYNVLCYHSKKFYDDFLVKKMIRIIFKITEDRIAYTNSLV